MIKYFCNVCREELTIEEIKYCHEMIGYGHFCRKHYPEKIKINGFFWSYTKRFDKDSFEEIKYL